MKLKLSLKWLLTAALILTSLNCVMAQQAASTTKVTVEVSNVVDVKAEGKIDWSKEEIRALGIGMAPAFAANPAQVRIFAREAAIVAAERNLLKVISGVQISSETTVENLVLANDVIKTKVNGLLKGAVIISEKQLTDNSYEVVMAVQMYGKKDSLASSINLADQFKTVNPEIKIIPPVVEPTVKPDPTVKPVEPPVIAPVAGFTGLIIDCRGMGLSRSQCPRILEQNNDNIWGSLTVSADLVNEKGIVGYYLSENDPTIVERVGKNPLKITALRVIGGKTFKTDAVVSPANAELIRTENAKTLFLEKLNVAFLTDK
ncbi:MAG: hypothetical protein WCO98_12610 [bacterium]